MKDKIIHINQLAIISSTIDKSIKGRLKDYYLKNPYTYVNQTNNPYTRIRQDVLKVLYQIELDFLKELIPDIVNRYQKATFYSYGFYKYVYYISSYVSQSFDKISKIEIKDIINYITLKDIKYDMNIFYLLPVMPFITCNNDNEYRRYEEKYASFEEAFQYDRKNSHISHICNIFLLPFIILSSNDDSDKMIIIPDTKFDKIDLPYILFDIFNNDSVNPDIEIEFYTNSTLTKLYEYDYKNNNDLYIIDQFNEM